MPKTESHVLRVGDTAEFYQDGNPKPNPEWTKQVVTEIRIIEEYEDKEGTLVSEISWNALQDYQCLVIVVGTDNWGRNEDVRPISETPAH